MTESNPAISPLNPDTRWGFGGPTVVQARNTANNSKEN